MNDMYLEETMLIQRLDDMWEQVYNRGPEQIADKKAKIIELANKLKKEV
jgi:hypothetical protein